MSTTFEVYPGIKDTPSFSTVICNTETAVNNYLRSIGVGRDIRLSIEIQSINGHIKKPFQLADKMIWDESVYAWFYIEDIPGGTDAYFYRHSSIDTEFLMEELTANPNFQKYQNTINNNIKLGYYWSFRRSAGQPAIIALCYGLLAASLAKLTEGIIYTDDGAWDYEKFPADPDDFIRRYFRLEYATKPDDIDFVKAGLASIRETLI